jgi:mannosylglycerate hydrolase
MNDKTICYVISHTHWDREWYRTFESFRNRLVFLMDELIDHLENDPDYRCFHLDGQTILIEDYLEIRPGNRERLNALLKSGRIIAGPWYVMPDEFLVSGESQIRNLLRGHEICRSHGADPMKNGFLLDEFGHHAQMPQILAGFGCRAAVLYRGIGDYPKNAFRWTSPNGSEVLAMKLDPDRSYSNFYFAVRWPFDDREYERNELVERAQALVDYSKKRAVSSDLLMLDGVDHLEIEPELPRVIGMLNEGMADVEFKHVPLSEYEKALRSSAPDLEEIPGELYTVGKRGINNQVLKNVLSSMVHLKQLNDECERTLTRWAEPFDAFASWERPCETKGFFHKAWTYLLQNHPHDSICGCSITRVHQDNEHRFNQCLDVSKELLTASFFTLGSGEKVQQRSERRAVAVFNAGQRPATGVVEAELELPTGTQGIISFCDSNGNDVPFQLIEIKRGDIRGKHRFRRLPAFVSCDVARIAFEAEIPACGLAVFPYEDQRIQGPEHGDYTYREYHEPKRSVGTMRNGALRWDTGKLTVEISPNGVVGVCSKETGSWFHDIMALEDGGDVGDGWNYRKPLHDRRISSGPAGAEVSVLDDGPLYARIRITYSMLIPAETDPDTQARSGRLVETLISTTLELKKGSSLIECATELENRAMDHRMRMLFATGLSTREYATSTPFWMQRRPIELADRSEYIETETNVFPNQGIITIADKTDRISIYNRGLYEVEVIDDKSRIVALTLFRSFRKETGVAEASELGRLFKELRFECALDFRPASDSTAESMIRGTDWRVGTQTTCYGFGTGSAESESVPHPAGFLSVDGAGLVLSSFRRIAEDSFVLRVFNASESHTNGRVKFGRAVARCTRTDLNESALVEVPVEGRQVAVSADPGEILTLKLEFGSS